MSQGGSIAPAGSPGSGTVTSFSFMDGSGFSGTVNDPTVDPVLSLEYSNGATNYVVSTVSGQGGYTTIQSAINQAVTDGVTSAQHATVLIWAGTYTENLTLADYVDLVSMGGNVIVAGNATYSGSNSMSITNVNFLSSNSSAALRNIGSGVLQANTCSIVNNSTGSAFTCTNGTVGLVNCSLTSGSGGNLFITGGDVSIYKGFLSCTTGTSDVKGTASLGLYYCIGNDAFVMTDTSTCDAFFTSLTSGAFTCFSLAVGTTLTALNSQFGSTDTYFVTGTGTFTYNNLSTFGALSAEIFDPGLNYASYATLTGSMNTAPAGSAASTLILGTPYQNTLGYDVILTVYIAVNGVALGTISAGVDVFSPPFQQTLLTGITTADFFMIPVTLYLPADYYALITTGGLITAAITGQQVTPV